MSGRSEALLRALTRTTNPPAELLRAAATHAARHDELTDLALDLITHPHLPKDAAADLVTRIAARNATSGRYAAGAYLTRTDHTDAVLEQLVGSERRLTVLRYAALAATSTRVLAHLAAHRDPEVAINVARNPHTEPRTRLASALRVDAAETAGRTVTGSWAMIDELPATLLDNFAAAATTPRLLLRLSTHPHLGDHLTAPNAARVADLLLKKPLTTTRAGGPLTWHDDLVNATVALACCGDAALRQRMRRWWGERPLPARDRARLHTALRGTPTRWGRWSWEAAAALAADEPPHADALLRSCRRRLHTAGQWETLLEVHDTFTGTVDQLLNVSVALSSPVP